MKNKSLAIVVLVFIMLANIAIPAFASPSETVIFDDLNDLSKIYKSSNIKAETFTTTKFDDAGRAVRTSKGEGYIIYKVSGLKKAVINAYETERILNGFAFYVSEDFEEWTEITSERNVISSDTWNNVNYALSDIPDGTRYLKISLVDGYIYSTALVSHTENQIGSVKLCFDENQNMDSVVFSKKNSGTPVFVDELDSLGKNWIIQKEHKNQISIASVENRKCLKITTDSVKDGAGVSDPYVTVTGLKLKGDIYELELDMMADSSEFDRTLMIGTSAGDEVGRYIYPICFGTTGTIGYRKADNTFQDFETPYTFENGVWYNFRLLIDTVEAKFVVYINGEKISEVPVEVLDWADGGIDEIRICNRDALDAQGSTYVDSIKIYQSVSLELSENANDLESEIFEFNDIGGHWGESTIKKLVSLGVISGYGDNSFKPDNNIDVDEFIKLVLTAKGEKIADNEKNWAKPYIDKAFELGIVKSGEFVNYDTPINRQQMARMVVRAFSTDKPENNKIYVDKIDDYEDIDTEYCEEILIAYSNGIINGSGNGKFLPLNNATRAEAAAIILRAADKNSRRSVMYTIGIYSDEEYSKEAENLAERLPADAFKARILTKSDMKNDTVLNPTTLDCLVVLNSIENSDEGIAALLNYVQNGGDLVTGGEGLFYKTLNTPIVPIDIYESYDYSYNNYENGTQLVTAEGQDIFTREYNYAGTYSGTSAISWGMPCEAEYIPVLETKGEHGQTLGYAAGVLTNYFGIYKDSNWLSYGIAEKEFYSSDAFITTMTDVLKIFDSSLLSEKYNREDVIAYNKKRLAEYEITHEPPTGGYIHVSEDGRHLVDGNGKDFYMVGASVYGSDEYRQSFNSKSDALFGYQSIEDGTFSVDKVETMFKIAKGAGINTFRWWYLPTEGKAVDVIKDLARKYEIYIFCYPEWSKYLPEYKAEKLEPVMKAWGDEPMFIGIDAWNEPDISKLFCAFGGNRDNPVMEYDPLHSEELKPYMSTYEWLMSDQNTTFSWWNEFIDYDVKQQICAAWTLIGNYMLNGDANDKEMETASYKENCPEWIKEMLGKVIEKGLKMHRDIMDKYSDHALLTVGYYNYIAMWPGNTKYLDFWNQHAYIVPSSYQNVMDELTTFDRLEAIDEYKRIPAILGEFGAVDQFTYGSDPFIATAETVANYDFLQWLYGYANGFGGASIWRLGMQNARSVRMFSGTTLGDGGNGTLRHGMLYYDGNPESKYAKKGAAIATSFFTKFTDTHKIGDGDLEVIRADSQSGTAFIFTADTAEYINNNKYESDRLQFDAGDCYPIVMLDWSDGCLELVSTQDVTVRIKPSGYIAGITSSNTEISGLCGDTKVDGEFIEIELLTGHVVSVKAK